MDFEEAVEAIEALERSLRRWRLVSVAALALAILAGGYALYHSRRSDLTVSRINVVDDKGRVRIAMDAAGAPGDPMISLRDAAGRGRLEVNAKDGGTAALLVTAGDGREQAIALGFLGTEQGAGLFLDSGRAHVAMTTGTDAPRFTLAKGENILMELPFPLNFPAAGAGLFDPDSDKAGALK